MKVIHFHCSKTAQKSYVDTEKEGKTYSRNFCLVCNEGGDGFGGGCEGDGGVICVQCAQACAYRIYAMSGGCVAAVCPDAQRGG